MTNRFLISVAALALIAGTGAVSAQGTGARESGGAATQSAPSSAGGGAAGGATTQSHESTEPSSGMNSTPSEKAAPGAAKGQHAQEATPGQPGQKSKSMSSETETKGSPNMKAETREGQNGNMKPEGRDNKMNAEGGQDRNGKMNAETKSGTENKSQATTGQAGAGAKISTEQRTKITTVIRGEHAAPVDHVNFSINIGTRVPREGVSFRPLPVEVVTIYPEWRGYEFFLVRDQIIVVDPRTLEIVAVLDT
jgi:Protein of unknown function (DUF1236)